MAHPLDGCYLSAELPDEPVMCIAHFRPDIGLVPQSPAVHFTILVDKSQVSASRKFIRFEHGRGSEIHGWQRREAIVIDEVIGRAFEENGQWKAEPIEDEKVVAIERGA